MFVRRASIVLAVCSACSFDHSGVPMNNGSSDGGADSPDSTMEIDPDAIGDARMCFGSFVSVCLTTLPTTDLTIDTDRDVNTDTGCPIVAPQPTGQTLCVLVGKNVTINARLRGNGPRPLAVLATGTLTISPSGMIDVGSYKLVDGGGNTTEVVGGGAVAGATLCGTPTNGASDNGQNAGGGGGAGGSFAGKGGAGARGANNGGGNGGAAANAIAAPSFMRGGCRGTTGGSGNGNAPGIGGAGGGAVLLIAGTSLANAGHIRAGGMGGYPGGSQSGGGGGGAGGMIVLDAPTIANSGILNANGGGGGEGGGGMSLGEGGASALTGSGVAPGGSNNPNGGDGGAGSWAAGVSGDNGSTGTVGAGAGGGGAGVIRVVPAQALAGVISPAPS